jgi:hypothetical protein
MRGDLDRAAPSSGKQSVKPMLDRAWYGLGVIYISARRLGPRSSTCRKRRSSRTTRTPGTSSRSPHRAGEWAKALAEQKRVDGYDPKMGAQIAHDIGLR